MQQGVEQPAGLKVRVGSANDIRKANLKHAKSRRLHESCRESERKDITTDSVKIRKVGDGNDRMPEIKYRLVNPETKKSSYKDYLAVFLPLALLLGCNLQRRLGAPLSPDLPGCFGLWLLEFTFAHNAFRILALTPKNNSAATQTHPADNSIARLWRPTASLSPLFKCEAKPFAQISIPLPGTQSSGAHKNRKLSRMPLSQAPFHNTRQLALKDSCELAVVYSYAVWYKSV